MRMITNALKEGANVIDLDQYYRENKDKISRISIDRGKYKYDIPQVELAKNIGSTFKESLSMVTSASELVREAENLTYEENLKRTEKWLESQERQKENIRRLKQEGIEMIEPESSGIQSFAANTFYHGLRQYADFRQLPMLAASKIAGQKVGQYLIGQLAKNPTPVMKKVFEGFTKAVSEGVEGGIEEYADQLATEDVIDGKTIFYSAIGGFAISGGLSMLPAGTKYISKKLGLSKATNSKTDISKAVPGEDPNVAMVKETNRVIKNGGNADQLKADDLKVVADDVAATSEVLGKPMSSMLIKENIVKIEGATPLEAREVYGPIIFKKVMKHLHKNQDNLNNLKELRALAKNKEGKIKFIGYINEIMENEVLTPEETAALEWGKRILDDKKIKGINFTTKRFLENTYEALERPKKYKPLYNSNEKGFNVNVNKLKEKPIPTYEKGFNVRNDEDFINPYMDKANYEKAIKDRVKHNHKYKKNVIEKTLRKDLNIPNKAKIKSINASDVKIDGRVTEVADIEWELDGKKYYSKVQKNGKKFEGSIYKQDIGKEVITKTGERIRKKDPVITRTDTPKEFAVSQRESLQAVTRQVFQKRHPELKSKEDFLSYLVEDPVRAFVEINDMLATENLSFYERMALQDAMKKLENFEKGIGIRRVGTHKPQITKTAKELYYQEVSNVLKKYVDGINAKEDIKNLVRNADDLLMVIDELLTNPDVTLTDLEVEALEWLRFNEIKKPELSDFKRPVKKKVINKSKPLWEEYPFTETEVEKEYFEELLRNRESHNSRDSSKRGILEYLKRDLNIPDNARINLEDIRGYRDRLNVSSYSGADLEGKAIPRNYTTKTNYNANIVWEHNGYLYYANVSEYVPGEGYRGDIYKTKAYPREVRKTTAEMFDGTRDIPKAKTPEPTNPMEDYFGFPEDTKISQEEMEYIGDKAALDSLEMEELKEMAKEDAVKTVSETLKLTDTEVDNKSFIAKTRGLVKETGKRIREKYNLKSFKEAEEFYRNKYKVNFEVRKASNFEQGVNRLSQLVIGETPDGQRKYVIYISAGIKDEDLKIGALRHEVEHLRDFIKDENFYSKEPKFVQGETIGDTINETYRGHFKEYGDNSFEYSYIVNDEMRKILDDVGVPNMKVIRNLGLDIPEKLDEAGKEGLEKILTKAAEEPDLAKRLEYVRKETDRLFSLKRKYENVFFNEVGSENKSAQLKQLTETEILLPFNDYEQAMKNKIFSGLKVEDNGNILQMEQIIDLFEENGANASDYFFYFGKLPKELERLEPQLQQVRTHIYNVIKEISDDTLASPQDIINTFNYDSRLSLEKLLPEDEIAKNLDSSWRIDVEKLTQGKTIKDELTGLNTTEKVLSLREIFAEQHWQRFSDAYQALKIKARNAKENPEGLVLALKRAKKITPGSELRRIVIENELDLIPEVKDFLEKHPEFLNNDNMKLFENTESSKKALEEAIIQSKKDIAKITFTEDMARIKGTKKNPAEGTYLHKLSRFKLFENEGYITQSNVTAFVREMKMNPNTAFNRFINDVSTAYAIKKTFPDGSYNKLHGVVKAISEKLVSPNSLTYLRDWEGFIRSELGEKLGLITKPTQTKLDRFVSKFLNVTSRINLAGPKAGKELLQEPIGMTRQNIMLYGGEGFMETYSQLLKSIMIIANKGDDLHKINLTLGDLKEGSIPLEMFNIIGEELDDYTGAIKKRVAKYGSRADKIYYGFNNWTEKINYYKYTQQVLKLAAYKLASNDLNRFSKYANLEELFKENTPYLKRIFKNLEIEEVDLRILKELENTESFSQRGIFDKNELSERITQDMYEEFLGQRISPEEFEIRKKSSIDKISKLEKQIVSDVSPTETTGGLRSSIDNVNNPINRNFLRITSFFKNSIQKQWEKMYKAYIQSNLNDAGKFDWSNKVYQKRLMKRLLDVGIFACAASLATDKDFYVDPIETISEKIDNLVYNPESALWETIEEQSNLWGLTTGSNAITRPVRLMNQLSKREYEKAGETILKAGLNNFNYDILKGIYNYATD